MYTEQEVVFQMHTFFKYSSFLKTFITNEKINKTILEMYIF